MCGIFGLLAKEGASLSYKDASSITNTLFQLSESRGKESAGLAIKNSCNNTIGVLKESVPASALVKSNAYGTFFRNNLQSCFNSNKVATHFSIIAHARLVTNGTQDDNANNQPVIVKGAVGVHNGIICNIEELWQEHQALDRKYEVDTELLIKLVRSKIKGETPVNEAVEQVFDEIEGTASTAILFEDYNHMALATNCGSLYCLTNAKKDVFIFSSEKLILDDLVEKLSLESVLGKVTIDWVPPGRGYLLDEATLEYQEFNVHPDLPVVPLQIEATDAKYIIADHSSKSKGQPATLNTKADAYYESMFEDNVEAINNLKRCSRCLLPETFPFIEYDQEGVCSYCHSYEKLEFKGVEALKAAVAPHRKNNGEPDCIVTLSGGRDSCYVLHYFVNELGMNPVSYTYDWGMVTDLARRNQARMCGKLGVEHIVISADINKKRSNIRKNVNAWLKRPSLGTIPLFMAGDKQYFYYANMLQKRYKTPLVIMGENMLETTNFKSGFCGIRPKFGTDHTFSLSSKDKMKMLWFYGKEYIFNPSYLNSSMYDTMHAFFTYYFLDKNHLNMFDFIHWDEKTVEDTLLGGYNWELSPDTTTTWRIGDGTAAFYNYIYYNVAGFSEFDTFRSNQIREGVLDREEALRLVNQENRPRYESFKWYCDTVGLDMEKTIKTINEIPKMYKSGLLINA